MKEFMDKLNMFSACERMTFVVSSAQMLAYLTNEYLSSSEKEKAVLDDVAPSIVALVNTQGIVNIPEKIMKSELTDKFGVSLYVVDGTEMGTKMADTLLLKTVKHEAIANGLNVDVYLPKTEYGRKRKESLETMLSPCLTLLTKDVQYDAIDCFEDTVKTFIDKLDVLVLILSDETYDTVALHNFIAVMSDYAFAKKTVVQIEVLKSALTYEDYACMEVHDATFTLGDELK